MDSPELGPLSRDAFLGGALTIAQPVNGYRAGIDPVLLAASVPAQPGQSVLDLGCGGGVAALCLGRRVPGLSLTGLELQPAYAALARQNGHENGLAFNVICGDVGVAPKELASQSFDHVIANPPFFRTSDGTPAGDGGRATARAGQTDLADWTDTARRRLRPGGYATFILDAARLPDFLTALSRGFGAITILPIAPRIGRPARLVIVQARKSSRAAPCLLAPLILHQGDRHLSDGDDYSPHLTEILRNGAPINLSSTNR